MSRYTVVWWQEALDELARLWPTDRRAITSAADEGDRRLARDPLNSGKEIAEGLRCLESGPLRLYFDVSEPDRLVSVYKVVAREITR